MDDIANQLELLGLTETLRRSEAGVSGNTAHKRVRNRIETLHQVMSSIPEADEIGFQHAGLCQTFLPHSKPASPSEIWRRKAGDFSLSVVPGAHQGDYVGVPYGAKARLILIHIQTEGMKSRTVHLGDNLAAFLRALGLARTGGPRGTIRMIQDQATRLMKCKFTMEWEHTSRGLNRSGFRDIQIADGGEIWSSGGGKWVNTIELTPQFQHHLREHAVPLDRRGIAHLSGNSLGLDLYALLAYRLPQLRQSTHIRWMSLKDQIGADYGSSYDLGKKVRGVIPDVMVAYPHAKVEATATGLTLRPSEPSVPPKTLVSGFRLIANGTENKPGVDRNLQAANRNYD